MPRLPDRFSDTGPLNPTSIVEAALGLVDREGIDALTMRRLGRELGVEAMSIYHHLPNKESVLIAVVARIVGEGAAPAPSGSASELLEASCQRLRRALRRHPNAVPLVAAHLSDVAVVDDVMVAALGQLVAAGFDDTAARWIVDAFVGVTVGSAMVDASTARLSTDDGDAAFETALRFLLIGLRGELGE